MLEYEIAAMYYFIASTVKATPYFEEVPENLLTPCVFYPTPQAAGGSFSLSTYSTDFTLYIKFMDGTTAGAYQMAEAVLQEIMKRKLKIPIISESGELTGQHFRVGKPTGKCIENGVYQLEITWKRYSAYRIQAVPRAQEIFFNGQPIEKGENNGSSKKER